MINETDLEEFYEQLKQQQKAYEDALNNKTILRQQLKIFKDCIELQKMMLELFKK